MSVPSAEHHDIVVRAETTASAEQVWRAWQDPHALTMWWSPAGTTVITAAVKLEPGGGLHVVSRGRGLTFEVIGQVLAAEPPHSFTSTWVWARADEQIAEQPGTITFQSRPRGDATAGTFITVTHRGIVDPQARRRNAEGWARALEGLTTYLSDKAKDSRSN